jgi:hypothetical protein
MDDREVTELSTEAKCNTCGYPIEAATGLTGVIPSPGDVSICIACGTPEVFGMCPTGMVTRSCTDDELEEIMRDETVVKTITGISQLREIDPDWPKGPKG